MFKTCEYCGVDLLPNGENEDGACAQCMAICFKTKLLVDSCRGCALGEH